MSLAGLGSELQVGYRNAIHASHPPHSTSLGMVMAEANEGTPNAQTHLKPQHARMVSINFPSAKASHGAELKDQGQESGLHSW